MPLLALFFSSILGAQTVTGVVSDATGPLPGVNIVVKGTTNGTQTDFDGNYSLDNVTPEATLVFSYVGFKTKEVAVDGRSTINVQLEEDAAVLDEIVVIGYGTTTVKDATGAVTAVTAEDFNQGVISSPEQLIQGKAAGVQITQSSGQPGAGIDIRIRGASSIRSNNNPLFVVDGIPLTGENITPEGSNVGVGSSSANNPLLFLNPNDIESISILKDASATAIYGSRGANGVVIITTKSGKGARGGKFTFSSNLNYSYLREDYNLLSPEQYIAESEAIGEDERDFGARTDWQDYIFRTAASQEQNLSYSNNYGDGNVRGTFGYATQQGIVEGSELERITGRINANHKFLDERLRFSFQGTISQVNDQAAPIGGNAGSSGDLLAGLFLNPTIPADPFFDGNPSRLNPAAALAFSRDITNTDRYLISLSTEFDILSNLTAKVNLGYDQSESERNSLANDNALGFGQGAFGNGVGSLNELETESNLLEATLNWKKESDNSNLDILAGYSYQDFQREGRNISGWGYQTNNFDQMEDALGRTASLLRDQFGGSFQQYGFSNNYVNFSEQSGNIFVNRLFPTDDEEAREFFANTQSLPVSTIYVDTFDNTDELQSFFGRVNYTIADKYLFTGTFRADGSSRFSDDNQYGYFPSGAFAWKLSEEDFVGDKISTLKLRLSAGITGNQDGVGYGNFARRERFTPITAFDPIRDDGALEVGTLEVQANPEPDLKWEETTQFAAGIDYGFANDKLYGSLDFYRRVTTDLLLFTEAAQPSNNTFNFRNVDSEIINQGVEFLIGYYFVDNEDMTFELNANVTYNENTIEELTGNFPAGAIYGQGLSNAFVQQLSEGQPLYSFYLREFEGFDDNGDAIQRDEQVFVGKSALPDVIAGMNANFRYKNWSANAFFTGQFGHYVYNNTFNAFNTAGAFQTGGNVTADVLTTGESPGALVDPSTRFLESGDFVRLQNASVSYNVPLMDKTFFDSFRISLTGQNLLLITDYSGLDPEVSSRPSSGDLLNDLPTAGVDYTSFPRPTTITLGINASF
ncbi:TonB-dependent receptor [Gangjinia marincola]|uniref:TonB-dependent receptor n=2 Tax=Gangjinia marincola TaxID=578463 RepID=A0ABP3XWU6_9FLAO